MARLNSGLDIYRRTSALLERTRADARKGQAILASSTKKDLIELLSGAYTAKQTRGAFARGSKPEKSTPTGRRRTLTDRQKKNRALPAKGSIPVNPINVQKGDLRRGVRLRKGNLGAQSYRLVVTGVPYAKYVLAIGGTEKSVSREVQPVLKKRFTPRNKALMDHLRASRRS